MSLQLQRASREDGGRSRVAAVSATFSAGELTVIIGPNGSGKSSLLQLLSGDLAPSFGRVRLDGNDLASWDRLALARRRAVLPQDVPVNLPYRVAEVVALGRNPYFPEARALTEDAVRDSLARVGMDEMAERPYTQLSGGQRARVQYARCLAQLHPGRAQPVLLLDEPTASLDPRWQHACLRQAQQLAREGWCVVCVLHDLNLAARYADRLLLLHNGGILRAGAVDDVLNDRCLDQVYGLQFQRLQIAGHCAVLVT